MNHFYRQFEYTLLQGFDIEGDDPREVVQNILFGEQYAAVKEDMAIVSSVNVEINLTDVFGMDKHSIPNTSVKFIS